MELQNGYGVRDIRRSQHIQIRPPDSPNFPIPPPHNPPQFHQYTHPHHLHLLSQQQPQTDAVVDPFESPQYNLIGLVGGAGLGSYRPPPSVVVAPHPLRGWININLQEIDAAPKLDPPLWKLESIGIGQQQKQISAMVTPPKYRQIGDEFGGLTSSPGSVSYETQYPNRENEATVTIPCSGEPIKKKKKKEKCCMSSKEKEEELEKELKMMAGFIEVQLVAHQERLHQRFTEAIERIDNARREREELWRAADAETARLQAEARAKEQALASTREALIVSYLQNMTSLQIESSVPKSADHGNRSNNGKRARKRLKTTFSNDQLDNAPSSTSPNSSSYDNENAECDRVEVMPEIENNIDAGDQQTQQDCDDHYDGVDTNR